MKGSASTTGGMIRLCQLASPALGSQCSVREKTSINTTPTQKPGNAWVMREPVVTARSLMRSTRNAASSPSGKLNTALGSLNTMVLLTSGFCMAAAVHYLKQQNRPAGLTFSLGAMAMGFTFLALKFTEYADKLSQGLGLEENMFFTFYWLLTGFHFIHVVVGLAILALVLAPFFRNKPGASVPDLEAGAAFWHMCDLIWLLLFPALYLVF